MSIHRYSWTGIDDPHRIDHARVDFHQDGLTAHGTSTADDYATAWTLEVGTDWYTRRLSATSRGRGWARRLDLVRSDAGGWTADAAADCDADLPAPGVASADVDLTGALDCDLGLCPLTNIMPIRRLGLLTAAVEVTPLVVAWVDVPSLQVRRSDQIYGSSAPGRVHYRSLTRGVSVDLTVDRHGIVLEYPGLARSLAGSTSSSCP